MRLMMISVLLHQKLNRIGCGCISGTWKYVSNEDFCLSTSDWQCLYSGTQNFVCNKDCCITTLDTELDWHPLYSWHPNYGRNVAVVFCILSSIFLVLQHFLYKYWPTGTKGAQKQMPGLTRGGTRGEWLPAHISSQTPPVQSVVSSWEEARRRRRRRDPAWGWGGGSAACAGGFKAAGDLPNWKASRWGGVPETRCWTGGTRSWRGVEPVGCFKAGGSI